MSPWLGAAVPGRTSVGLARKTSEDGVKFVVAAREGDQENNGAEIVFICALTRHDSHTQGRSGPRRKGGCRGKSVIAKLHHQKNGSNVFLRFYYY